MKEAAKGEMVCDGYPRLERGDFWMESSSKVWGKLGVRCCLEGKGGEALHGLFGEILGFDWPLSPCTYGEGGKKKGWHRCMWLGPDEWLLMCDEGELGSLVQGLEKAGLSEGVLLSCVEETDQWEHILLGGEGVRMYLGGCVMMDMEEVGFPRGKVVGTMLGNVRVLLLCGGGDGGDVFEILVRRSEASYVWRMLEMSSRIHYYREGYEGMECE
jgi:sarcosine oxidase subunit gamma